MTAPAEEKESATVDSSSENPATTEEGTARTTTTTSTAVANTGSVTSTAATAAASATVATTTSSPAAVASPVVTATVATPADAAAASTTTVSTTVVATAVASPKDDTKEEAVVEEQPPKPMKHSIRLETWAKLDAADVVLFPRPCTYRIPRFKGEIEAAHRLTQLDYFKEAKVIKVTLDKAHECVRNQVIECGKDLIAGSPGLREAVFLHVKPPMEPNKSTIRMASSRAGINHLGTALDFASDTKVDLIIVGSVAVDKTGRRIGKGEGFSDLEFSLLMKLGAVAPNATILTVVHDLQVYDKLSDEMFKEFDVPVDVIVTPSQVIEVEPRRPRPMLLWNLLSNRRVNSIPIIKQLLDREQVNGMKVELKEADSDMEERQNRLRSMNRVRRRFVRRRRNTSAPERRGEGGGGGGGERTSSGSRQPREGSAPPPQTRTRMFRRRRTRTNSSSQPTTTDPQNTHFQGGSESNGKNGMRTGGNGGGGRGQMRRMRRLSRPRYPVDFSVKVDGLTSGIRIRDLKAALMERGVRPRDISWRGTKGVALLHFSKANRNNAEAGGSASVSVDEIVALLQGLKVKGGAGLGANSGGGGGDDSIIVADLNVEPAKPVTRIDFIDVST